LLPGAVCATFPAAAKKKIEEHMADIKSSIELAMERTRNLSLSEEERRASRAQEWAGRMKGWLQKYFDGALKLVALQEHLREAQRESPEVRDLLAEHLRASLHLEGDNDAVLALFPALLGIPADELAALLASSRRELEAARRQRREDIARELAARGVSGSAVLPNLAADRAWQEFGAAAQERFSTAAAKRAR
jgi:hypothetical protein